MASLVYVARSGTEAEFLELYEPSMATSGNVSARGTLFHLVVGHKDPRTRVALASRLLDDGADASLRSGEGNTAAHIMLGQKRHDPPVEAPLLARLFDEGSDVNWVVRDRMVGTPLYMVATQFKYTDEFFAPFYDVFFSRPDLDLVSPTLHGVSDLAAFRTWEERRPDLIRRAEEYLRAHGVDPDRVE